MSSRILLNGKQPANRYRAKRRFRPLLCERLEDRLAPATLTVVNTNTSGEGSLGHAMLGVGSTAHDIIEFNIPATDSRHFYYRDNGAPGVSLANVVATTADDDATIADIDPDWRHSWYSIQTTGGLPNVDGFFGVTIDGYTQPGSRPNTLTVGNDAVLRIELTGVSAGAVDGLRFLSGSSTVRGLVINRFQADGIEIQSPANVIEGNFIGTDPSGTLDRGNGVLQGNGIFIRPIPPSHPGWEHSADNNRIGGTTPASRNVISGTDGGDAGVFINVSSGNVVQGNYIGTNAAGSAALGNSAHGVAISTYNGGIGDGLADGNLIGGTTPGAGNLISGNAHHGVLVTGRTYNLQLMSVATNTVIQGNFIGTNATGTAALPNGSGFQGIVLSDAQGTLIGGTIPAARNIISANGGAGIQIGNGELATTGNIVQGNYIGTDVTGTLAVPNVQYGIELKSPGNTIGGTAPGARNVISGNQNTGLYVRGVSGYTDAGGTFVPGATIQGNYIGTDATGILAVPNATRTNTDGLTLSVAQNVIVGGPTAEARNIISGNRGIGVLFDATGSNNVLQGNLIGVNAAGNPLGNTSEGVRVHYYAASGPRFDLIAGNTIAHNASTGVTIINGWRETIVGNSIYSNGAEGVFVGGGFTPTDNRITANSIHSNARLGIDLYEYFDPASGVTPNDPGDGDEGGSYGYAGNRLQNYPVLTSATSGGGSTTVTGSLNSMALTLFRIEFFANSAIDPTGFGEGQTYLGSHDVTTDVTGNASFTAIVASAPVGSFVTATATDPAGNTSEFSLNRTVVAANPPPASSTGLMSWWKAENNALDSAGNNHGSPVNGVSYAPGRVGQAFSFDGVNDYVHVFDDPSLEVTLQLTIAGWIRPDEVNRLQLIFDKYRSPGNSAYQFYLAPGGGLVVDITDNGGSRFATISSPTGVLSAGAWAHVATTFNSGQLKLYVNGVVVASHNDQPLDDLRRRQRQRPNRSKQ